MKKLKVALFGSNGRMGKFRRSMLESRGIDVRGFDVQNVNEESEFIRSDEIMSYDGFVIATPLKNHQEYLDRLMYFGKPIFIEKPLLETSEKVHKFFDGVQFMKRQVYVAWQRRKHQDYIELIRDFKASGQDWKKISIVSYDNPSPPPHVLDIPNYLFKDFMGHDINELLWVTNNEIPQNILVTTGCMNSIGKSDYAKVTFEYSGGRIATIEARTNNPDNYYRQELIIETEKATFSSNCRKDKYSFPQFYMEAFQAEVDEFISVMKGESKYDFEEIRKSNLLTSIFTDQIIEANKSMNLDIVGNGNFSQYIQTILPSGVVGDVVTRNTEKKITDIAKNKNRAYVCSPDLDHDEHTLLMLSNNKAVICEKPLFGIQAITAMAKQKNLPFMMGFQRRFDVRFQDAKDFALRNIEKIDTVILHSHDPVPYDFDSSFVISNSLIHDFDTLVWIFGSDANYFVKKVDAKGSTINVKIEIELKSGQKIEAQVWYGKENESYEQRIFFVGFELSEKFGFDYHLKDGVKVFDSYRDAYQKQFASFLQMNEFDEELAESYKKTVALTKGAIKKL